MSSEQHAKIHQLKSEVCIFPIEWNCQVFVITVVTLSNDEISEAISEKVILGKGGYGIVYAVYMRTTKVAIKYLNEVNILFKYIIFLHIRKEKWH